MLELLLIVGLPVAISVLCYWRVRSRVLAFGYSLVLANAVFYLWIACSGEIDDISPFAVEVSVWIRINSLYVPLSALTGCVVYLIRRRPERLLWLICSVPLLVMAVGWVGSFSTHFVPTVYDSKTLDYWILYRGSAYRHRGLSTNQAYRHRFEVDWMAGEEPFGPDLRVSLWYPTTVAAVIALVPAARSCVLARRRRARRRRGACSRCGYDLTGNVSGLCPECGEKL